MSAAIESASVRCLVNVLRRMEQGHLTIHELARTAKIEESLLRAAVICRVSLDRAEWKRLARAISTDSETIGEIGDLPAGEIHRMLV